MKKIIIATAIIFTSGLLSLNVNDKSTQHASAAVKLNFYDYKKELGSGD